MFRRLPLAAAAVGVLALPTPATADQGSARLTFDDTLLRARVSVTPISPAQRTDAATTLPVRSVSATAIALDGGLTLRCGNRRVRVTRVQLTPSTGDWSLRGRVGGKALTTLMTLVASPSSPPVTDAAGSRVSGAQLRLTRTGARLLTRALRPRRALTATTIGRATVNAQRAAAGARTIVGGTVTWGYNSALRGVFQRPFPPLLSGGVTQGADGLFVLPVTGGTWNAATNTASITTGGAVRIGYQMAPSDASAHGFWVRLADTRIDLTAATGQLTATSDSGFHDTPPVPVAVRTIATLAPSAPATGGTTLTWTAIPATIAAGGEELVAQFTDIPGRPPLGDMRQIDPVTVSVQLG